jgi:type II secretory pathway pseudopilin PulG
MLKKTLRGFTVAELFIVVSVLTVLALVLSAACSGNAQKNTAKEEATKYARELGVSFSGISCADYDSDGDGYVSCTIRPEVGDLMYVECRGAYSIGHGCRIPKIRIPPSKQ